MTDVFISYASQDRERVRPLVEEIEAKGWDVWWDREIGAGVAFDREIERAIDDAGCIVVMWSKISVESEWVRTEATEGLAREILVPIAIDEVRLPLAFRRTQTINLYADEVDSAAIMDAIARYVPLAARNASELTPHIGREDNVAALMEMVKQARDGVGNTVLLSGEAGVGKTRLAAEVADRARKLGVVVLRGHSLDMQGAPPYQPVIEQLEQAARIVPPEDLRAALGNNAPEVATLMPQLRQLFPDIAEPTPIAPEQQRQYLLHGFSEFIERAAGVQPMMLVFEDLHWADDSTCILLRHLASRIRASNVLIVGSYRDTELDSSSPFTRALQEFIRERLCVEMPLERLDKDEVHDLVQALAGDTPPRELIDLVYAETEGNPFFVEEVYRHLDNAGALFDDSGAFRSGIQIADTEVPRGVRLVIEQRLERVSDDCRTALSTAAVIGRTFSFDVLASAVRIEEDALLDAMDEADNANLVEDISRAREPNFRFVHEQIRQTLLNGLSLPRRQRQHLRIADALEGAHASNLDAHAGAIAYHLYQSGAAADPQRTTRFLSMSGTRALSALAFEDALRAFDMTIEVLEEQDPAQRAVVHGKRALALRGAARVDDSLEALADAIALATDTRFRVDMIFQRVRLLTDLYRGTETLDDLTEVLDSARSDHDAGRELEAQRLLAEAHYTISLDQPGSADRARESAHRAIDLARASGDRRALAQSLLLTSQFVDYWVDYREQASRNLSEAHDIANEIGDEDLLNESLTMGLRVQGFVPISFEVDGEDVLQRLEARLEPIALKEHLFWMIVPTRERGRLQRSVELADAAIALAAKLGVAPVQYPTFRSYALIDMGRFDEAYASIQEEVSDLPAHRFGAALQEYGKVMYLMAVHANAEAVLKAKALMPEALSLDRTWMQKGLINFAAPCAARDPHLKDAFAELEQAAGTHPSALQRAEISLSNGASEESAESAARVAARMADLGYDGIRITALELQCRGLKALERWDELVRVAEGALTLATPVNFRAMEWRLRAHTAYALTHLNRQDEAETAKSQAVVILESITATIPDPAHAQQFSAQPLAKQLYDPSLETGA